MVVNEPQVIAIAGAGGDLGGRIVKALLKRGAKVRAIVRPGMTVADGATLTALGADLVAADPADVKAMANALTGSACVISALNGLGDRKSVV